MNKTDFILNDNIELLWELIVDTDIVKNNVNYIDKIKEMFDLILPIFYDKEKNNPNDLMSLNKMFISVIINKIKPEFFKEKEIITSKDIKAERINKFDTDFMKQKNDFDSHNTIKTPTPPVFNDKIEEPLEDMELIIKQTIAKRNFDVEQFNKGTSVNLNSTFLKPQETSIKKEKEVLNKNNEIKYIKIDNKEIENSLIQNNIIELPPIKNNTTDFLNKDINKRISWGTNVINYLDDDIFQDEKLNNADNLLLKLKKTKTPDILPTTGNPVSYEEIFKILNNKIDILTNMVKNIIDNFSTSN
jgi:hypothetical protein